MGAQAGLQQERAFWVPIAGIWNEDSLLHQENRQSAATAEKPTYFRAWIGDIWICGRDRAIHHRTAQTRVIRGNVMPDYRLHCFALSGNCYKIALFLQLAGADWESVFVDYLGGETQTDRYRSEVNELGEAPVLEHNGLKLSQSGVILDYLAKTTGQFGPRSDDEAREIWRWMLFDNHKFTSYYATLRFMVGVKKSEETPVTAFLRERAVGAYRIVDKHLADKDFILGSRLTIADVSLAGYVFMPEPTGIESSEFPAIEAWKARLQQLPSWRHPYDILPGPTSL